jgi:hypothetical protein
MYDPTRILKASAAADAQFYTIRRGPFGVTSFWTGSLNGKTPDEVALANLADLSEQTDGTLTLYRYVESGDPSGRPLASARYGCVEVTS